MANKIKEKYHLASGEVVPGTTTIVGELGWNKNMLVAWANRIGLNGIESRKFVDDKAAIGILAHAFVLAEFQTKKPDTSDYTSNQIKLADNCLLSYREWKKGKIIKPVIVEEMLVSEEYKYGGMPDFFGEVDKIPTLVDYKTGKGIYSEYIIQAAAYRNLIREKDHKVEAVRILNIPRSEDESFMERILTERELDAGWQIFLHLLAIWNLKGAIKKEG